MKELLKKSARTLARVLVLPVYLVYRAEALLIGQKRSFQGYSQLFSLIPGLLGEYLRREFYRLTLLECASDCCISFGTIFSTPHARIGSRVYIGSYCIIGTADIGADTLLASRVSVMSGKYQHGTSDLKTPIRDQAGSCMRVVIGKDCWIGEGALIADNVGDHSVVGAGSVVFKPVNSGVIVSGNPAEVRRKRGDK